MLGAESIEAIHLLTPIEYRLRMKAQTLINLDREREIYLQAYLPQVAQATKKRGKKDVPKYPTFDAFFNYEERKEKVFGKDENKEPTKKEEIRKLILIANAKGG